MAQIALLNDTDQIVRIEREEKVDQTAGVRDGFRWVPVETDTVDNSTGPDTVTERTGPVVEAARVAYTITIRDMTAQELADRSEGRTAGLVDETVMRAFIEVLLDEINILRTEPRTTFAARTLAQLRSAIKARL